MGKGVSEVGGRSSVVAVGNGLGMGGVSSVGERLGWWAGGAAVYGWGETGQGVAGGGVWRAGGGLV